MTGLQNIKYYWAPIPGAKILFHFFTPSLSPREICWNYVEATLAGNEEGSHRENVLPLLASYSASAPALCCITDTGEKS